MKKAGLIFFALISIYACNAQSPVGQWKKVSHISSYEGQKFDSQKALLKQRPCTEKIVWEINADASFHLNAANSGCDESYKKIIQQKMYSKTKWKLVGNKFTVSAANFAVGQTYLISFSGNRMTWVGTEGQGTIIYQKL